MHGAWLWACNAGVPAAAVTTDAVSYTHAAAAGNGPDSRAPRTPCVAGQGALDAGLDKRAAASGHAAVAALGRVNRPAGLVLLSGNAPDRALSLSATHGSGTLVPPDSLPPTPARSAAPTTRPGTATDALASTTDASNVADTASCSLPAFSRASTMGEASMALGASSSTNALASASGNLAARAGPAAAAAAAAGAGGEEGGTLGPEDLEWAPQTAEAAAASALQSPAATSAALEVMAGGCVAAVWLRVCTPACVQGWVQAG